MPLPAAPAEYFARLSGNDGDRDRLIDGRRWAAPFSDDVAELSFLGQVLQRELRFLGRGKLARTRIGRRRDHPALIIEKTIKLRLQSRRRRGRLGIVFFPHDFPQFIARAQVKNVEGAVLQGGVNPRAPHQIPGQFRQRGIAPSLRPVHLRHLILEIVLHIDSRFVQDFPLRQQQADHRQREDEQDHPDEQLRAKALEGSRVAVGAHFEPML
jgi:hypothetical protein